MPIPHIVNEVMTRAPHAIDATETVRAVALIMDEAAVGAVIVERDRKLCGILTDRDIVVRCLAKGGDPDLMTAGAVCSPNLTTLSARDTVDNAIALMASKAIRRIPVVDNGRAVGIVSLGDLAQYRDPTSALGGISSATPNG
jgi:CBS domain-containing protein